MAETFRSDTRSQHRLPEPVREGALYHHAGRQFVTVQTADGLEWRETAPAVADHEGRPVKLLGDP